MNRSYRFFISFLAVNILLIGVLFAQGYHVCVGSYKNLGNAEEMVQKLEKQSIAAFVSVSKVKNQDYYRVLLTKEFKKIDDARKYRNEVKNYSFVKELGLKDFWVCQGERFQTSSKKVEEKQSPKKQVSEKKSIEKNIVKPVPEPKVIEKKEEVIPEPEVLEKKEEVIPEPEVLEKKEEVIPEPEVLEKKEEVIPEPEVLEKKEEVIPEPEVLEKEEEILEPEVSEEELPVQEPPVEIEEDVETEEELPFIVENESEEIKTLNINEDAVLCAETPYSVLVRSYKFEQFAENDKNRLAEAGFDVYSVNTFDDEKFFSFNIHAGVFATEAEAEELRQQFTDAGIQDTVISNYLDIEGSIKKYDEVISSENVIFDDGLTELPSCIPDSVAKIVKHFPANKDFPIQEITILDYENFLESSYKPSVSSNILQYIGGETSVHAALSAVYRDELYGKQVSIFFANAERFPMDELLGEVESIQFGSKDGQFDCVLYEDAGRLTVCGSNLEESLYVKIVTTDFTREEFINFLIDSFNDKALDLYPQMRRTFFILPEENPEIQRKFICFDYKKIGEDYASMRENADWALPIVGHSLAKAYFNENFSSISLGIYDLDYDFNAKKVYKNFFDSKTVGENADINQIIPINDAEGLFLENQNQREFSFSTKSYVIAINVDPNSQLQRDEMVNLGLDLEIWH